MGEENNEFYVNPIAYPKLGKKMEKNILLLIKKIYSNEKRVRRGVKDVTKNIRKGAKGICVLAADVSPIDVYSHIPFYCEENSIPFVFVSSRALLGHVAGTKKPTSLVLILEPSDEELKKIYKKYFDKINMFLKN